MDALSDFDILGFSFETLISVLAYWFMKSGHNPSKNDHLF